MTTYQSTFKNSERSLELYANNNRASITVRDLNNSTICNLYLSAVDARKLGQELLDTFPEPLYTSEYGSKDVYKRGGSAPFATFCEAEYATAYCEHMNRLDG